MTPTQVAELPAGDHKRLEIYPGIWIDVPRAPWSDRDRAALAWAEKIDCPAWAEKYRYLSKSAIPGRWRNDNAPYLPGIMNLANARGILELAVKKAAQIGVSEAFRTLTGYWAHQDPAPMGLLLPTKDKGRQIVELEVMPLFRREFERAPELRALLSTRLHDIKKEQIQLLNGFILYLMWAGSPTSTASNPMKRVVGDEVDKYPLWSGDDADPLSLVKKRMRTYPESLLLLASTPTTAEGMISQEFDGAHTRLYYLIACPHCGGNGGGRQRMVFGQGGDYGVKWSDEVRDLARSDRKAAAAKVLTQGAWYQCAVCHGKIDERQKRAAVRAGTWGTVERDAMGKDGVVADGEITDAEQMVVKYGRWPAEKYGHQVGMQVSSLNCCWESWTLAHIAAEFLQAQSLAALFAFKTSTLGETWEEAVAATPAGVMAEKTEKAKRPEGVCPVWTARLIATVDTQSDHFWLVIRAWGPAVAGGMRSARVWHGRVNSFDDVEQWCWRTPYRNEDPRLAARICDKVLIDSGGTRKFAQEQMEGAILPSRVMDVYKWALLHAARVTAIKGDARPEVGQFMRRGQGELVHDRMKRPVPLMLLDVHHFQDELAGMINQKVDELNLETGEILEGGGAGGGEGWELNSNPDAEYCRHMEAMHKVTRFSRGKRVQRWEPKQDGLRVDYRALEGYQVAGAFMTGVHLLPPLAEWWQAMAAERAAAAAAQSKPQQASAWTSDGRAFVATQRN